VYLTVSTSAVPDDIAAMMGPSPEETALHGTDPFAALRVSRACQLRPKSRVGFDRYVELSQPDVDLRYEVYVAKPRVHCYAVVQWFWQVAHSSTEWCYDVEPVTIIPVHRFKSRFTPAPIDPTRRFRGGEVFEILPIPRRIRLSSSYKFDS
jgi:hypothetical protein